MYSPIFGVAIVAGYKIKEMKYLIVMALVGAVIYVVNNYIKAFAYFPGYLKSNLIEGDAIPFVMQFFTLAILLFGVFTVGSLSEKIIQKYIS